MNELKHKVVLLLGSNLGNCVLHISNAIQAIREKGGEVQSISSLYETEPWGVTGQPNYLNAALILHTHYSPLELLAFLKQIEAGEGRTDQKKYAPRILDIDILFYDDLIFNSKELTIPHPKLHLRKFVLVPVNEIAPGFVHPVFKKTIPQLLNECIDELVVKVAGKSF